MTPSSPSWLRAALADLPTLLVDHAHCERKAAATALTFVGRHPRPQVASELSRLAREELVHFERVVAELAARGIPLARLPSAGYAAALFAEARRSGSSERPIDRLRDELIVCALIEARSHERFVLLVGAIDDDRLRALYDELACAEARHGQIYIELAQELGSGDVSCRREQLEAREAEIVARPGMPLRMHAGG